MEVHRLHRPQSSILPTKRPETPDRKHRFRLWRGWWLCRPRRSWPALHAQHNRHELRAHTGMVRLPPLLRKTTVVQSGFCSAVMRPLLSTFTTLERVDGSANSWPKLQSNSASAGRSRRGRRCSILLLLPSWRPSDFARNLQNQGRILQLPGDLRHSVALAHAVSQGVRLDWSNCATWQDSLEPMPGRSFTQIRQHQGALSSSLNRL